LAVATKDSEASELAFGRIMATKDLGCEKKASSCAI
jgi:hypothetical protein